MAACSCVRRRRPRAHLPRSRIPLPLPAGGVGRTGQAKNEGNSIGQGRWPVKSCEFLLNLLENAESNAESKGLDVDALYVSHIQVNQAQRGRRRWVGGWVGRTWGPGWEVGAGARVAWFPVAD